MSDPVVSRRAEYIKYLHGLDAGLRSFHPKRVSEARRTLACLRNSFVEGRQLQGYEIVFQQNPPDDDAEQETWLLVGGLFALHPLVWRATKGPRSLGASMGKLSKKLVNNSSVGRRFTQLLAKDRHTLPYHLRQAIRLLSAHDIPVHYGQLLDDLVVVLGRDYRGDRASKVRLKWAREFHMPVSEDTGEPSTTEPPENTA
ncbi:type I-E CRISPR-associated protein Cse2/CasB [Actinocrispum wychmicini]|uniref:CRISPR system Cascade subunit CasB n=1 Tax=Actinocrispum wychmicini TaxID=1213861 RepID=A0A4R2K912_9PSEU|nr:type I-E CRISPR-associated protein Cse2/CasB [Actinocrispum wychmicini]TCO62885.1 CRISPR system Cascade subunit CasB [Actinocrispum wychmicini]